MKDFDVEVPTNTIENDVKPPTFEDSEVFSTDEALIDYPETVDPLSLDEMRLANAEDLECKTYTATICLTKFPFDFDKELTLRYVL